MATFWFLKNERLVDALTEYEKEFPILDMYSGADFSPLTIYGDILMVVGENAGYFIDDYFFNEAGGEAKKLEKFLGEGWVIKRVKASHCPESKYWDLFFKKQES